MLTLDHAREQDAVSRRRAFADWLTASAPLPIDDDPLWPEILGETHPPRGGTVQRDRPASQSLRRPA